LIYSVAGIALLGVAGFFIYRAMAGSLVYFIVPSEYAAEPERYQGHIRLGGIVEAGSINYDNDLLELNFNVTDGLETYPVRYSGAPPELFKADTGVVVAGNFEQNTFVSDEVLIKHTEEYRPAAGEAIDVKALKEALE
jgi:cytochrome c-type biogenesis protein CcmE